MLVAIAIACQLSLQEGGVARIIGGATKHGYPMLVARTIVCRGSVCRDIILVKRLA